MRVVHECRQYHLAFQVCPRPLHRLIGGGWRARRLPLLPQAVRRRAARLEKVPTWPTFTSRGPSLSLGFGLGRRRFPGNVVQRRGVVEAVMRLRAACIAKLQVALRAVSHAAARHGRRHCERRQTVVLVPPLLAGTPCAGRLDVVLLPRPVAAETLQLVSILRNHLRRQVRAKMTGGKPNDVQAAAQ